MVATAPVAEPRIVGGELIELRLAPQRALPISMNVLGYQTHFIDSVNRIFCMSIQRFIMVTI